MNNASEKELLEKLSDFPKYELSQEKRMETIRMIRAQEQGKSKRKFNFQSVAAAAAMLVLILMMPLLFFTNGGPGTGGSVGEEVKRAEEGVFFALMDAKGKAYYADRNFGIPNKVSVLAPLEWIEDDYRSVGKIMVYLWGEELDLNQRLKIEGVHVKTGTKRQLATTVVAASPFGDAEGVTSFQPFEKPGIWNLHFTIGNKKVGEFSIEVKESYVQVGDATILLSKQNLLAGTYENIFIEIEGSDLPPQVELKVKDVASGDETVFIFTDKTDYTLTDGRNLSKYYGSFTVNHSGDYEFSILGQSEKVEVKLP